MGTTNNQSLVFKANNQQAGKSGLNYGNTSWGHRVNESITNGTNNTAIGENALHLNSTGSDNTATCLV